MGVLHHGLPTSCSVTGTARSKTLPGPPAVRQDPRRGSSAPRTTSTKGEWRVSASPVVRPENLSDCSQSEPVGASTCAAGLRDTRSLAPSWAARMTTLATARLPGVDDQQQLQHAPQHSTWRRRSSCGLGVKLGIGAGLGAVETEIQMFNPHAWRQLWPGCT